MKNELGWMDGLCISCMWVGKKEIEWHSCWIWICEIVGWEGEYIMSGHECEIEMNFYFSGRRFRLRCAC